MKNIILYSLLAGLIAFSCVRANPKCKKAHKNIKKMHLNNWY